MGREGWVLGVCEESEGGWGERECGWGEGGGCYGAEGGCEEGTVVRGGLDVVDGIACEMNHRGRCARLVDLWR